jgi:hypothetical protein
MKSAASLVVLIALFAEAAGQDLVRGDILDKVECRNYAGQSYALYLPAAYDPAKKWPVLYAFDPGGRAKVPLALFREAAEELGVIVACSHNSRNGPWEPIFAAAAAMWADTHERLALDDDRVYVTGFSGGARAASIFPKMIGRPVAGIVACGAGLAESRGVGEIQAGAYCGLVGTADFNFWEMMELDKLLDRRADLPHWIRTFDGGHEWPPASACAESLKWLELAAARKNGPLADPRPAEELIAKAIARAAAIEAQGDVFRAAGEFAAASSAFSGLGNTDELKASAARLRATGAFKKASRKEEERGRDERDLLDELYRNLVANEKTVVLRQDMAPLFARIDRLSRDAENASDASEKAYARRALMNVAMRVQDRGTGFITSKAPAKAVLCFEIGARACGFDPGRCRGMLYNLACAQALDGNIKRALGNLRRAVEKGFSDRNRLLSDTDLDALRNTPEFREILDKVR